ncbi:2-hydroxyacid dehydrogenase [Sphingomonas immobilis]|uniref:2-hydroxyacid dehydrogenase n=1 Tax=Sphingomonas immobilis TaxID=3063997 RepID=A0ABT8ZXL2_9SPHN|nr:2-hydroxyacid dehydrogenase [Sphingomonas sp. CA1-15]MDO7842311.1 2-hydroxyacid dehydrogenase [Sphingomonas sp. CA1-15]
MPKPRLLVMSDAIEKLVRPGADEFEIVRLEGAGDRDAFLAANGAGIGAALVSGMERFDAARFDLLPDLGLIATVAAGMSGIDLDTAKARGVAVINAGDLNAGDVADFAVTLMLAQTREVIANDRYVREDRWPAARRRPPVSVSAQKVGIVGLGHIGLAIARRLEPFGCEIAWWGPRPKPDAAWPRIESLEELASWSSVLMVAARGDDSTRGLITADVLAALGPDGLIVNVSRGFVIDEPAMIAALQDGRLGAAALDVFEHEPINGSDWAGVPNVLMAPHVAGATQQAFARVFAGALDNLRRHFAGEPLLRRVV